MALDRLSRPTAPLPAKFKPPPPPHTKKPPLRWWQEQSLWMRQAHLTVHQQGTAQTWLTP
jgi:hypothetical protein